MNRALLTGLPDAKLVLADFAIFSSKLVTKGRSTLLAREGLTTNRPQCMAGRATLTSSIALLLGKLPVRVKRMSHSLDCEGNVSI